MDNSFITQLNAEDEPQDLSAKLGERKAELVKIIEALGQVITSEDWRILKELVFDRVETGLDRRLMNEAKASDINAPELYRLQGQLSWAKRYANLDELKESFKVELRNIKKQQ